MKIELADVGKRFRHEWIIRHLTHTLQAGGRYAVTGPNGSGKSTLLRILSGQLTPSRGKLTFVQAATPVKISELYSHLAYAAPYIDVIEEFTLEEALRFHRRFRPTLPTVDALVAILELEKSRKKHIRYFSSGMKQRLRLALAICDTVPLLLLDEPTTNLDATAQAWYQNLLQDHIGNRTLVIASNEATDYRICDVELSILKYK